MQLGIKLLVAVFEADDSIREALLREVQGRLVGVKEEVALPFVAVLGLLVHRHPRAVLEHANLLKASNSTFACLASAAPVYSLYIRLAGVEEICKNTDLSSVFAKALELLHLQNAVRICQPSTLVVLEVLFCDLQLPIECSFDTEKKHHVTIKFPG